MIEERRSPTIGTNPIRASRPMRILVPGITKAPSISCAKASRRSKDCSMEAGACRLGAVRCIAVADTCGWKAGNMGWREQLCHAGRALFGGLPGQEATGLARPQRGVEAAPLQQLGMRTLLDDAALIHHH